MIPLVYRNDRDIARRHLLKHLPKYSATSLFLYFNINSFLSLTSTDTSLVSLYTTIFHPHLV